MDVNFKDIPDSPGYKITSKGEVFSCWKKRGIYHAGTESYMSDEWHRISVRVVKGCAVVSLRKKKRYSLARLVLELFVGPCPNGMECCHSPDPNPMNCCLENLRWDTHKNNIADKVKHGTHQTGSRHPRSLLTESQVVEIRTDQRSNSTLARHYGVNPWVIRYAKKIGWKSVA